MKKLSFVLLLCLSAARLSAQFTSGANFLTEAKISDKAWHLTSKITDNPLLGVANGDLRTIGNDTGPLGTFIIDEGPSDDSWWTSDERWFSLRSASTGLYVTVESATEDSPVSLAPYSEGAYGQQFRLVATAESDWYKLRCRFSQGSGVDLVLEIDDNGFLIAGKPKLDPSPRQKFAFNLALPNQPDTRFVLINRQTSTYLSDQGINVSGTPAVHLRRANESVVWQFLPVGATGYYKIYNPLTKQYLTAAGQVEGGDALTMGPYISFQSDWTLERDDDNTNDFGIYFKIRHRTYTSLVVTADGSQGGGTIVLTSTPSGASNQDWAIFQLPAEPEPTGGNYQRIIQTPGGNPGCPIYGEDFKKALAERVGLSPDPAYFPLIQAAIAEKYGAGQVDLVLKKIDLGNAGHRVDLATTVRSYLIDFLPSKARPQWTAIEEQAVSEIETRIRNNRIAYANAAVTAWEDYAASNNTGDWSFSVLLATTDAQGFVWPDPYPLTGTQAVMADEYYQASHTFNIVNTELIGSGFVSIGGTVAAYALTLIFQQAIFEGMSKMGYFVMSSTGPAISMAVFAACAIAAKSMEVQEVQLLLNDINSELAWAQQPVRINEIVTGHDRVAYGKLLADLDYVMGAPVTDGFQFNTNDNLYLDAFDLYCSNVTVDLDASGQVSVPISQLASVAILCGGPVTVNNNSQAVNFDCSYAGGTVQVAINAVGDGFSKNCVSSVQVRDNTAPQPVCKNATVYLSAAGTASIGFAQVYQSGTDNCGAVNPESLSRTSFTCTDLGTNTVTLTANDGHGNTGSCQATVTVADNVAPTIVCKNKILPLGAAGMATLAAGDVFQSGADNCGTVNLQSVSQNVFNCAQTGTHTVALTANDGHGNTATCNATVTVVDNTNPSAVCKNASVALNAAGTASIGTASVFHSASDNCSAVSQVSVTPNTFSCANVGANNVALTVADASGNQAVCYAVVTVTDNAAPTVVCKNAFADLSAAGSAGITPSTVFQSGSDNCGAVQLASVAPASFSCGNLGNNTVTLTVNDGHGNTAQCQAAVTVRDLIAPVAQCKNVTANLGANGSVTVAPASVNNGSSDNCGIASMSLAATTFNCANIGANLVKFTVSDAAGNTSTCNATITVKDQTAPTASCKNATIYLNSQGQATLTPAAVNNNSTDNCGITSMSLTQTNFTCANLSGSTIAVAMTLKDAANNTSSCVAQITVRDNLAPEAFCENTTVQLNAQGKATVYTSDLAGESLDNCNIASFSPASKLYTTANLGPNNLAITVKDWSNNASTCTAQVTVLPYGSAETPGTQLRVDDGPDSAPDLTLYPNPATAEVSLQFQLEKEQSVELRVFDTNGRLVLNRHLDGTTGQNRVPVQVGQWAAGLYIVDLRGEALQVQKRLVVQRD